MISSQKADTRSSKHKSSLAENIRLLSSSENDCISCNSEFSLGLAEDSEHPGSCSPAKFDSGQGSEGSASSGGGAHSPPASSSSSSSEISDSLARQQQDNLLDTSDESSLDSLELDQVRYILKPKLQKYNNNNNNNSSVTNNKNAGGGG